MPSSCSVDELIEQFAQGSDPRRRYLQGVARLYPTRDKQLKALTEALERVRIELCLA